MGKREQINKRLRYQNPNRQHVFVCFIDYDKDAKRLDYIMRRHHVYLDYQRLEVSVKKAMQHNMEYADLMERITKKYWAQLTAKGYNESRGDNTGCMQTSSRRMILVYSKGVL